MLMVRLALITKNLGRKQIVKDSNPLEKLANVYYKLAIGEGDIKKRLCVVELNLLSFSEHDLPQELQEE